jgi:hypothetical protein
VEIESVFKQDDQLMKRTFVFSLESDDGISNHHLESVPLATQERTIVRLLEFRDEYEQSLPRGTNTLAQRIVEHCLEYHVLTRMPVVTLYEDNSEAIQLDHVYDQLVADNKPEQIRINGRVFDIVHFFLHAHPDLKHHISYCANQRVVLTEKIGSKIPNLPATLSNGDGKDSFIYAGYVSSEYLDKHANHLRTGFDTMPEDGLKIPGELTFSELEGGIISASQRVLQSYTETVRIKKEEHIKDYVSNQAPQFRHIIKNHADCLNVIPPEVSDDKLDSLLYDINREIENNLTKQAVELLQTGVIIDDDRPYEERLDQFTQWWQEYNELGKSTLAKYIVHRKMILTFLEKALHLQLYFPLT